MAAFKEWCKENRNNRLRKIFPLLTAKLRGYYNYYGLIGNYESLRQFYSQAMRILYKWLNRRSQRRSFNFTEFTACLKRYQVPQPRIVESKYTQLLFNFWSWKYEARILEEPGAVVPHASLSNNYKNTLIKKKKAITVEYLIQGSW